MQEHARQDEEGHNGGTEGHDGHGHNPHVHHHFDTEQQQFDSDKLGMWLFLTTEVLMFSGLFCAYAVYRANHPEMFIFAHHFLDVKWGFINTIILLFSSFTMAWAVRAAQLGQKKLLINLLAITILCGFGFMGVKAIEYTGKFSHGMIWGKRYAPDPHYLAEHVEGMEYHADEHGEGHADSPGHEDSHAAPETSGLFAAEGMLPGETAADHSDGHHADDAHAAADGQAAPAAADPNAPVEQRLADRLIATSTPPVLPPETPATVIPRDAHGNLLVERSKIAPAAQGPSGLSYTPTAERIGTKWSSKPPKESHGGHTKWEGELPSNPQVFFSIYFTMTGLHGLHVIFGMIAIFVVLVISARGGYGADYMTPVDLVGLFWHLVDLVWIFLFPLLYLIH